MSKSNGSASGYPQREKFFANHFCRTLTNCAAAQELGPEVCWLLTVVVHEEDHQRYDGPVRYYNEQLMPLVGMGGNDRFALARRKAVAAGWLHYEKGSKGVPGKYWVTIPSEHGAYGEPETFLNREGNPEGNPEGKTETFLNREGNPEGNPEGKTGNTTSLIPIPNTCGEPPATPPRHATSPPSKPPTVDSQFEEFWRLYPGRNGRKREKAKARTQWRKLAQVDRDKAIAAAPIYGREEDFVKDAFRWLRDHSFEDWLSPPEPAAKQRVLPTREELAAEGYTLIEDIDDEEVQA